MSTPHRDKFRVIQKAILGENSPFATGIPNPETKAAWQDAWDFALAEYRQSQQNEPQSPTTPATGLPRIEIGADHWIVGVKRMPLPPRGNLTPLCVVEHFTAGATAESSVEFMSSVGTSAHVVIDRDGEIIQCVPFNRIAYHAGKSNWKDPQTGKKYSGLNDVAIGIEIANAGNDGKEKDAYDWAKKQPGFRSKQLTHQHGGAQYDWEDFYEAQMASVRAVTKAVYEKYALHDVTGHDYASWNRKNDPGPCFPWIVVRNDVGLSGEPQLWK